MSEPSVNTKVPKSSVPKMKINLTSKSPIKVAAVTEYLDSTGIWYELVCHSIESSDIPEQPVFETNTIACAKLRIAELKKMVVIGPEQLVISIESGIKFGDACVYDFSTVIVEYGGVTISPSTWSSRIGNCTKAEYFSTRFDWHHSGLGYTKTYGQFLHEKDPEMYPNPKNWSDRESSIVKILKGYKLLVRFGLKHSVELFPDFKAKGVMFKDMSRIFACSDLLQKLHTKTGKVAYRVFGCTRFTHIVAIESRGYPLGMMVWEELHYEIANGGDECWPTDEVGIVLAKKKGKVPGDNVVSVEYKTEYSTDCLEMMGGLIGKGDRVLIVDDLVATGGSLIAAKQLVEKCGATVMGALCFLKVDDLYDAAQKKFGHPIAIIIP